VKKYLLFLFLIPSVYGQTETAAVLEPFQNSFYFAAGAGWPQGFRGETGFNFEAFSFGLTFGIADRWSSDPAEGTIGILARVIFYGLYSNPYLLYSTGTTLTLFSEPDTYSIISAGVMIQLKNNFYLRPELGYVFTTRHISGGTSLFGSSYPAVFEKKNMIGFNISFEAAL
jgi:hypothetical protein